MIKVCPRCKLPQEGINECEYCGLKLSNYSNKINRNWFYRLTDKTHIRTITCPECRKRMRVEEKQCPNCGFTPNKWMIKAGIKKQSEKKTIYLWATGGIVVVFCQILFTIGIIALTKPESLTTNEIVYIRNRIPELSVEIAKVRERINYRLSYGALYGRIGDASNETWSDRYQSEIDYFKSIQSGLLGGLRTGRKIMPPERFRRSIGYENSPDKNYFKY